MRRRAKWPAKEWTTVHPPPKMEGKPFARARFRATWAARARAEAFHAVLRKET